jgi:peptidoglycan L-alanyl-D-glutamate endopeptidase CwlK
MLLMLKDINKNLAERVEKLLIEAKKQGLNVYIFHSYRSFEKQNKLYAQGRTTPGPEVTKARGGLSWHNYGLAVDIVFKDSKGNWSWDEKKFNYNQLGKIGKSFGLSWGGDWKPPTKPDKPHFQLTYGLTIRTALKIYVQSGIKGVWLEIDARALKQNN